MTATPIPTRTRVVSRVSAQVITILVDDARRPSPAVYRLERNAASPTVQPDPSGPFLVWHEAGHRSHLVGDYVMGWRTEEEAFAAALAHHEGCSR